MSLLVSNGAFQITKMQGNSSKSNFVEEIEHGSVTCPFALRSSIPSSQHQSTSVRRRSLNIPHFNALQNAVSNLARIDDFDLEELGYGFFSDVFKATHKQNGKVMVLKRNKTTNTKMNILREVQLMNRLSHPHILKFKGVCVHEGQLHALTEFINGGDLDKLVTKKNVVLSWKQRVQLALDVAKGMEYLHSVGIFHRDLTAKNCLVRVNVDAKGKKKYSCIVADLGLAEKIPRCIEDAKRLTMVGTPYIMAPEELKGKPYNEKVDVFSFGLMICQLIALVSIDPEELPRSPDFGLARDLFRKMVNKPTGPDSCPSTSLPPPESFLQLAFDCCQLDPKSRPSFNEIVTHLEDTAALVKREHAGRPLACRGCENAKLLCALSKDNNELADRRRGTSSNSEQSPLDGEHFNLELSHKKRRRSSRLSRSFSDISRELLNHFANMIAAPSSPNADGDVTGEKKDAYSNPFAALQYLEGGRKLIDQPSLALLEMTFDLATSDSLKTSWSQRYNSMKKSRRSQSTTYEADPHRGDRDPSKHHPSPLHHSFPVHEFHRFGSETPPQNPSTSPPEESPPQCDNCDHQMAQRRAMVLSPLANNLASWWCRRQQSTPRLHARHERHSLATVMSLLSKDNHSVPRSISLPDLSRMAILFHPADDSLVTNGRSDIPVRTKRSRTTDDVFSRDSRQEPIAEEAEDDSVNISSSLQQSNEINASPHSELLSETNNGAAFDLACDSSAHTCSDDATTELNNSSEQGTCLNNSSQRDMATEDRAEGEDMKVTAIDDAERESGDFHVARSTSFSSSSSSGCSTSSLLMTLQTGEVTQRKRLRSQGKVLRPSFHSTDMSNNNLPVLCRNPDNLISDAPPFKSNNRDSGYEEDHLHSVLSPSNDFHNHHVTWDIPEEPIAMTPSCDHPVCGAGEQTSSDRNECQANALQLHPTLKQDKAPVDHTPAIKASSLDSIGP